jgi:Putative adhesin
VDGSTSWVRRAGLAAIVAVGAATALTGCGEASRSEHSASSSYVVSDAVTALRVDGHGGDIEIVTGDGEIKVTETMEYRDKQPVSRHSVSNGELLLQSDRCDVDGVCNVDYKIQVPAKLAVKLSSGGGTIDVSGVAAPVDIDSGGGKVIVADLSVKNLTVNSGGGAVEASLTAEPDSVAVDTSGGGAKLKLPGGPYAVDADSGGGPRDVSVKTSATSAHKVTVKSGGGDIKIQAA